MFRGLQQHGYCSQDQEKLEDAVKAYKKALSIKPDYAEAYNNLGNALKAGQIDDAIKAYKKAIYSNQLC